LAGDELEHAGEEIGELLSEAAGTVAGVRAPEDVSAVARQEFVEAILRNGLAEWGVAGHHDEQDDADGEKVD